MPYTFKGAFHARRVGICWDGSRLAARAVRDAMPLLEQAEAITIITINAAWHRSEEHTSELQSRLHLVCRLLLEKKKKNMIRNISTSTQTILTSAASTYTHYYDFHLSTSHRSHALPPPVTSRHFMYSPDPCFDIT